MRTVQQRVQGKLIEDNGRYAILLQNPEPRREETEGILYLRYAYILHGVETAVFPIFLLDDWGNEVKRMAVYKWMAEYGEQFPRAEIFGFEMNGEETQYFVRDLELLEKPRCYAYARKEQAFYEGKRIEAILWPVAEATKPEKIKRPSVKRPSKFAKLTWWQLPPHTESVRF